MRRALLFAGAVLVGACTIMNGYELPAPGQLTSGDGGPSKSGADAGAAITTSPDGGVACVPKHPPAKPAPTTGTDTTIIVALESMLAVNNGAPLGFDLDDLCTCPDNPPCTSAGMQCDANGDGTDNAGSNLSKGLNNVFNPIVLSNQRILNGVYGLLVRVDGYDQQPDDDAVAVTIIRSVGIDGGPNFTTVQAWPSSTRATVATTAWVANGTLVANFDAVDVPFLDDTPKPAQLQHAMLVAPIVAGPTLQSALLVGRAPTNDLIASVGELEVFADTPESTVCQQSQFASFASATCALQDINREPARDHAGTTSCDALSLTVSLTLAPATIGPDQQIPAVDERCDGVTAIQCK